MPQLDAPPPPPDVKAQMGDQSGFAGVGQMMSKQGPSPAAAGGPKGAVMAAFEAVNKVFEQMTRLEPGLRPYVQRAQTVLKEGMASVSPKPDTPQPQPGGGAPKPPEGPGMSSFPG